MLTAWGQNQLSGYLVDQAAPTGDLWLALCLVVPDAGATGSTLTEPIAPEYARISLLDYTWSYVNGGWLMTEDYLYDEPTEEWGALLAYAFCTAVTAGEVYSYEIIDPPVYIGVGSRCYLPPTTITVKAV